MTSLPHLPTELHLAITPYLTYPDALSLKHTSRHFYSIVDTGVQLKVAWLIDRRRLDLECPRLTYGRCTLRSDEEFCSAEISRLMRKRRRHEECWGTESCVVIGAGWGEGLGKCRAAIPPRRGWRWWWKLCRKAVLGRKRGRGGYVSRRSWAREWLWLLVLLVAVVVWWFGLR
ncbi:MAG: hypothetical protein M1816_008090 [Peltula sp. TS41687]|nr:MAG: hypothetical protein M1816_008090 [Peltula sp. TS41687]